MAFGPADRDGTNQNKDRTTEGSVSQIVGHRPGRHFPIITGPSNRHNHYQRKLVSKTLNISIPRPQAVDRHRVFSRSELASQIGVRVLLWLRTASRINVFPQLELLYPPTQRIRVIAQRLVIGSGLRLRSGLRR